jgi:hypothetical protein
MRGEAEGSKERFYTLSVSSHSQNAMMHWVFLFDILSALAIISSNSKFIANTRRSLPYQH